VSNRYQLKRSTSPANAGIPFEEKLHVWVNVAI